jgi:hypothetical protein
MRNLLQDTKINGLMDTLGVCASSLCMVHCMAMPFVISFLPAFSERYFSHDMVHQVLAFFVVFFCLSAVIPGYLKHRNQSVFALMLGGLVIVLFATFGADALLGARWETPLITGGNFAVVGAHLLNRKFGCCSQHKHIEVVEEPA